MKFSRIGIDLAKNVFQIHGVDGHGEKECCMLAKKTVKNQITLPKKIADLFPNVEYFDVRTEDNRIILEPLRPDRAEQVRKKLASLRITEADIAKAVSWARKRAA